MITDFHAKYYAYELTKRCSPDSIEKLASAVAEVQFSYEDHEGKVSTLEQFLGKSGWLTLSSFSAESLDQSEDYLIFTASTDDGSDLDEETASRLFILRGKLSPSEPSLSSDLAARMAKRVHHRQPEIQRLISERNGRYFGVEAEKLDRWADDLKIGLEQEIKELDRQIKDARRIATLALTLEAKLAGQKQIKALESQRNEKRRSLFEAQDKVDQQREKLIASIEGKLTQKAGLSPLFTIHWRLA